MVSQNGLISCRESLVPWQEHPNRISALLPNNPRVESFSARNPTVATDGGGLFPSAPMRGQRILDVASSGEKCGGDHFWGMVCKHLDDCQEWTAQGLDNKPLLHQLLTLRHWNTKPSLRPAKPDTEAGLLFLSPVHHRRLYSLGPYQNQGLIVSLVGRDRQEHRAGRFLAGKTSLKKRGRGTPYTFQRTRLENLIVQWGVGGLASDRYAVLNVMQANLILKKILDRFWSEFGGCKNNGYGYGSSQKLDRLIELSMVVIPYRNQTSLEHRRAKFDEAKSKLHPWRRFGACFACQNPATDRHHIVQLQNGGINSRKNVVSLCSDCHSIIHPWLTKPRDPSGDSSGTGRSSKERKRV